MCFVNILIVGLRLEYLSQLSQEIGGVGGARPNLAEGERDEKSCQEIGDRVIQVCVLREAATALQKSKQCRPSAEETERSDHQSNSSTFVMDKIHLSSFAFCFVFLFFLMLLLCLDF